MSNTHGSPRLLTVHIISLYKEVETKKIVSVAAHRRASHKLVVQGPKMEIQYKMQAIYKKI
jgi:hypothetical protein